MMELQQCERQLKQQGQQHLKQEKELQLKIADKKENLYRAIIEKELQKY